jgi:colicin import membrane protein
MALATPQLLGSLEIDSLSSSSVSYEHELVNRLKLLLRLPQYGEVEIDLTLERSGKVAKIKILSAENSVNRQHVEKNVPTLVFPPFGNSFDGEKQHTFRIKLGNEISQ